MLSITAPATTTFYRGINLNGPAIAIDGNSWQSGISNPNFTHANSNVFENQSVTLIPSTDANRATMLRSSIWGNAPTLTATSVANGVYDVYVYVWEDNAAQTYSVYAEGALVLANYNSGITGTWAKLGPFRVTVGDTNINVATSGGDANLSGIEIRSVSTTNVAVTGITASPSSVDVVVGKSVQVGRTITPANATNRSVTWTSSNTAVAVVNNDGWITGVSPGTATLTASLAGFTSQATVTVSKIPSSYSARLNGTANEKYGLARSIAVMPGDVITAEVYAKYVDTNTNNWNAVLNNLMATIANGTAPGGTFVDGGAAGSIGGTTFPFIGTLSRTGDSGTGPKAYLNYLIFDKNYVYKSGGFKRLSSTPKENGTDVAHERLAFDGAQQIAITEPGYVYIYISNENDTPVEVYFDDFKVTQTKGAIVSSQDYYPFGLTFNSYQRENSVENRFKFQGQEHIDDLNLGWDSFKWRNHQPEIGRFFNVDPLAEKYNHNSPYAFAENRVIDGRELEGLEWVNAKGQQIYNPKANGGKGDYTQYATATDKRLGNSLQTTEGGRGQFGKLVNSGHPISIKLNEASGPSFASEQHKVNGIVQLGKTDNTIYKEVGPNGQSELGIDNSEITINEGSIDYDMKHGAYFSGQDLKGLSFEQILGATLAHEIEHTTVENAKEKDPEPPAHAISAEIIKEMKQQNKDEKK